MEAVALADADEFQRALDHAQRRVAVAVHQAVGERAVVGADAQRAAQFLRALDQRGKRVVQALQLGFVFVVRVFLDGEFFLVGVIARVDAHLLDVLDGLHRGGGQKVDVGDQRQLPPPRGGDLRADFLERARGLLVRRGDADDFAAGLGQAEGLAHRRSHVLRQRSRHRLHPQRIRAADADDADLDLASRPAHGAKARGAVRRQMGSVGLGTGNGTDIGVYKCSSALVS